MINFIDALRESKTIEEDGATNVVGGMAGWTPPIGIYISEVCRPLNLILRDEPHRV